MDEFYVPISWTISKLECLVPLYSYDANDLPLSEICATLRREIDFMAEHPVANMSDWESVVTNVSAEQLEKEMRMENALDGAQADKTFKLLSKKQAEAGKMV